MIVGILTLALLIWLACLFPWLWIVYGLVILSAFPD